MSNRTNRRPTVSPPRSRSADGPLVVRGSTGAAQLLIADPDEWQRTVYEPAGPAGLRSSIAELAPSHAREWLDLAGRLDRHAATSA
jgi:hypothetical protein